MPDELTDYEISRHLASGRYRSFAHAASVLGVSVRRIEAVAQCDRISDPDQMRLDIVRRQLLASPPKNLVRDVYHGDFEAYRRCVEANFPKRGGRE